jgi:hypothetical protein
MVSVCSVPARLVKEGAIFFVFFCVSFSAAPDGVITDSNLEKVYNIKVKVVNVDSGVNRKICVPIGD